MPLTPKEFSMLPPVVRKVLGSRFALPTPDRRTFVPVLPDARNRGQLGDLVPGNTGIVPPHLRTGTNAAPLDVVRLDTHRGRPLPKPDKRVVLPPPRPVVWHEFDPRTRKLIIRWVPRPMPTPALAGLPMRPGLPRRVQQTAQLQGLSLSKALKWVGNNMGTVLGATALVGGAYWAQDQAGGWSQLLTSDGWSKVGDAITGTSSIPVEGVAVDPGAFDSLPSGTFLDPSIADIATAGPGVVSDAAGGALDWSHVFDAGAAVSPLQTLQDAALQDYSGAYLGPALDAGHSYGGALAAPQDASGGWASTLNTGLNIAGKALGIASAFTSGEAAPPNAYNRAMAATAGAKGPSSLAAAATAGATPKKALGVDPRTGETVYSDGSRTKAPAPSGSPSAYGAGMISGPSSGLPSWALPVGLLAGIVVLGLAAGGSSKG